MGILRARCSATWQCALLLTSSHIWAVTFDWLPAHSRGGEEVRSSSHIPEGSSSSSSPPLVKDLTSVTWLRTNREAAFFVLFLPTSSRLAKWNASRRLKAFSQTPDRQPRVQQTKVNNHNNNIETFYVRVTFTDSKTICFFMELCPKQFNFLPAAFCVQPGASSAWETVNQTPTCFAFCCLKPLHQAAAV